MTLKKIYLSNQCYFLTTNILNKKWLFGQIKNCAYIPKDVMCDIVVEDLNFYREKFKFLLNGYVIMPDHLHIILMVSDKGNVSEIMRDIKSHTSFEVNKILKRKGECWQEDFYEHAIRNEQDFTEKMNYIHNNPIRANLVENPGDFKYSSYRSYFLNDNSLITIDKI